MKKIVLPIDIDQIKKSLSYCDAYLVGIKGLSINMNMYVDINDLDNIKQLIGNKELFIGLNKNMFNSDINKLRDFMIKLNDYDIKGVFYYDVGVLNIYNSIDTNYELVWASNHATTNYNTINYWYNMGVNYCLVSSDITFDDIIEIINNTTCKLIVPVFGYQTMFNSRRHIVKNYLDYFKLSDNSNVNYIKKEGKVYPIIDDNDGTVVYTNYILNGVKEYNSLVNNGVDYCLLNGFNIESEKFIDVLKLVNDINDSNIDHIYKKINSLFNNIETGFFYKDTIAKVKKNEK